MLSKRPKGATIQEEKKSGIGGLLWMLFGAVVTIAVGVVAYKSPMFGFNNTTSDTQAIEKTDEPTVKPKIDTDKDNDYQFYDILPDQKMKPIPDSVNTPQKVQEDIEKKTKQFKPDVVVTEALENQPTELHSSNKSQSNTNVSNEQAEDSSTETLTTSTTINNTEKSSTAVTEPEPAQGDNEMVIVYENATYDGGPVKKTTTLQSKNKVKADNKNTEKPINNDDSSASVSRVLQSSSQEPKTQNITEQNPANQSNKPELVSSKTSTDQESVAKEKQIVSDDSHTIDVPKSKQSERTLITKTTELQKPSKSYVLQINSYEDAESADKRRAQVLMAGVDARVIRRSNGGKTIYRVVSGAMDNAEAVVRAQQALQRNGIDSLIVEQRQK